MKKMILLTLIVSIVTLIISAGSIYADPIEKLKSGAVDVVTAPLEFGSTAAYYTQVEETKLIGLIAGVLEGSAQVANKSLAGVVKILTFPFEHACFGED